MTPLSLIHNDFSIRVRRFNGYSRNGRIKYTARRNVTPHQLARIFGVDKVYWWYEKAQKQDKPFSATKKEMYKVTFHKRRSERIRAK